MNPPNVRTDEQFAVRIPADVEREDRILAGLTARQLAILTTVAAPLWAAYLALDELVPVPVFAVAAFPIAALAVALALGRRDGLPLDRLALAALRHARSPHRLVPAPEGVHEPPAWVDGPREPLPAPLRLPARAIGADGVVDLGRDGAAVVVACSTLNFALRTPAEQRALVTAFGRWLNSLTGPAQILVRAQRFDLGPRITRLHETAPALPHPALEQAARGHADYLADLATRRDLLAHQVLVVVREPLPPAAPARAQDPSRLAATARRRAEEATRALAGAGIVATVLDEGGAAAALRAATTPQAPPTPAVRAALAGTPIIGIADTVPHPGNGHPRTVR